MSDRKNNQSSISPLRRLRKKEQEIDEELRFHLEMEEEKLRKQGMTPGQARREARLRFGGTEKWRHEVRDVGGVGPFERLISDLRFGLRILRSSPVFTAVAILTLALGIGASTAIFSVVDGILLSPLPYSEPDRLVSVWADYTRRDGPEREWWGYPNYHDLRTSTALAAADGPGQARSSADSSESRVFSDLALWGGWNPTLTHRGQSAEQIAGATITHGMLERVLGVQPILGTGLRAEDDVPNAPRVVLMSERLWRRSFSADPAIVDSNITLNGESFAVLGILPASFRQPLQPQAELWTPYRLSATEFPGGRGSARFRVLGRLADDVSIDQARARAALVGAALEQEYPEALTGVGISVFPLKEDVVAGTESGLVLLLAAVAATLLIVCINLANLLLARGAARSREFSLRTALGASTGRLIRQLLTESVLLAGLGGVLGIGVAIAGTRFLVSLAPAGTPRIEEVAVDPRVLSFCALVSLVCGLLFGLFPAIQAGTSRIASRIGRNREGSERVSEALVAGQVAAALVLLIGAGLILQSFANLARTDLGFEPEGLISVSVFAPPAVFPETPQAMQYLDAVETQLVSVPGVTSVARTDTFPLAGFDGDLNYAVEGSPPAEPGQERIAWFRRTTPGYFPTAGIAMVDGRDFAGPDSADAAPVVIVNETLARKEFGNQSAVGRRLNINGPDEPKWREIVGVATDVKNFGLREAARPAMYAPYAQVQSRRAFFVLQTDGDLDTVMLDVRQRFSAFDDTAAPAIQTAQSFISSARSLDRFVAWLLGLFAGVALLLAAIGLYGVVSYRVTRRAQEIGLRMALGAKARTIANWVVGRSLRIAALGVGLGIVAAYFATRALGALLFEVQPTDPFTFFALAGIMVVVAALASGLPAWRAARLDPARVLKAE